MASKTFLKIMLTEVVAMRLRVHRLERQGKGEVINQPVTMDSDTQAMLDRLMAAIEADDSTLVSQEAPEVIGSGDPLPKVSAAPVRKVTKVAPPQVVATNAERTADKYDAMEKDELLRRIAKRGGNAEKIMAGYHARARTIALRVWLRKNPPKTALKAPTAAKRPAKATVAAKIKKVARRTA